MISIVLTWSMKQPSTSRMAIITSSTPKGDSPEPCTSVTSPLVPPEKLRICEKVVAPMTMNRIIPEMAAVPRSESSNAFQLSER